MLRAAIFLLLFVSAFPLQAYDPLATKAAGATVDLVVKDAARERDLPVKVYLPAGSGAAPVVLFSHGLGGTREGSAFLGQHWAGRGYAAVFLQHPGSDDAVWRGTAPAQRMAELKKAASLGNFLQRVKDVPMVLDALTEWQRTPGHALAGRLDLERVGMSGHSFGAVTTQAVCGQSAALGGARFTDPRLRAAISMSHSPAQGTTAEKAFGSVKVPWMLMTGTKDDAIVANFTPESRATIFPALPPGGKYELVLDRAEHSAFTERALPADNEPRNPNHHRVILATSTAFWDAYLKGDAEAKAWLDGAGPRSVMESGDQWQRK